MKIRTDTVFYRMGQIILIPIMIAGFWLAGHRYIMYNSIFECVLLKLTGLPCLACGGTRAVYYLFSGDIYRSFINNPIIIYGVLAYLHFMGLYFYRYHFPKSKNIKAESDNIKEIPLEPYIYGAFAVVLIQWLIKILGILIIN